MKSAYKRVANGVNSDEYEFKSHRAKEIYSHIAVALKECRSRKRNSFNASSSAVMSEFGPVIRCVYRAKSGDYFSVDRGKSGMTTCIVKRKWGAIEAVQYKDTNELEGKIKKYVHVTKSIIGEVSDDIKVRSLEEIELDDGKDLTWLKDKNYKIIDNISEAMRILKFLNKYKGPIGFDVETTGLNINMFSKVNSDKSRELAEYNANLSDGEKIKCDSLVGVIFAWKEHESFYFPLKHKFIKNLFDNKQEEGYEEACNLVREIVKKRDPKGESDIGKLLAESTNSELTPDVIFMMLAADIIEKNHMGCHGGVYEAKVCMCYDVMINLRDDTLILHQLLYKYRTGRRRGEPSGLKYLAKKYLGIDQLELSDFFNSYVEDNSGLSRGDTKKKNKSKIDFSYMNYEGTWAYAPADGDMTLGLLRLFKNELYDNKQRMTYLYNVELVVSRAIAYMEFFGHRIDEERIAEENIKLFNKCVRIEYEIRCAANMVNEEEKRIYEEIKGLLDEYGDISTQIKKADTQGVKTELLDNKKVSIGELLNSKHKELQKAIAENEENKLNLGSPSQVSKLIYDVMGVPPSVTNGEVEKSVAKAVLKQYVNLKDEEGNAKYPAVSMYMEWKKSSTLITKFFDKLQEFMYPGGFIFSSYGQITTATGRMSCSKPNAQQYPKSITKIVVPRNNCIFMDGDYSQIESRIMVTLAKETKLIEQFADPDVDFHTLMAALMFDVEYVDVTSEMRQVAKSFNFGIPYGMGVGSLAIWLTGVNNAETRAYATEKMEDYFRNQRNVEQFFKDIKEAAQINGYTCTDFFRERHYQFLRDNGEAVSNEFKAMALRQAGNSVIQGTAADIFKIAVAKVYTYIIDNGLFGKVFLTNMIHDELLMEIDTSAVNTKKVAVDIVNTMQYELEGYPPLFVGAGFGGSWNTAKDKPAEIHPLLIDEMTAEVESGEVIDGISNGCDTDVWIKYITERILEFRVNKIKKYMEDESNWHKTLDAVISGMITNVFAARYGISNSADNFVEEVINGLIKEFDINSKAEYFIELIKHVDEEEDVEYEDDEEDENAGEDDDRKTPGEFRVVEDSDVYGIDFGDIIKEFGYAVHKPNRLLGIDCTNVTLHQEKLISEMMSKYRIEESEIDNEALRLVALTPSGSLMYSEVYIKNIDFKELDKIVNYRAKDKAV